MSRIRQLSARELLALNIRRLRAAYEWTQEDLAWQADMDRSFLAHVERAARNLSIDVIERLAHALEVPIAELFRVPDVIPPPKRAPRH
ncbi:helix-turn-helix transcriptional regulator [Cupriavidus necator]|uniref:helix-turn-helix domain-containing protein n=1 Tax=Cupriavidus necator TaxID=106590 RepID=UPI0030F483EB